MQTVITSPEEIASLEGNTIIGMPQMNNTTISFAGEGNILFCEDGVVLKDSRIQFPGSNALVYLSASKTPLMLNADIWSESVFSIGANAFTNGALHLITSERQCILIGDDALFSFGIWMRTADPHLVYSCDTKERLNKSRSVCVGDHVWIGQDAMILKGTTIGSGAIVGARAICAGKTIPSNTSWAGNPAKQIGTGVFFTSSSVHNYSKKQTKRSMQYTGEKDFDYRVSAEDKSCNKQRRLAKQLLNAANAEERLAVLQSAPTQDDNRYRYAIAEAPAPVAAEPADKGGFFKRLRSDS